MAIRAFLCLLFLKAYFGKISAKYTTILHTPKFIWYILVNFLWKFGLFVTTYGQIWPFLIFVTWQPWSNQHVFLIWYWKFNRTRTTSRRTPTRTSLRWTSRKKKSSNNPTTQSQFRKCPSWWRLNNFNNNCNDNNNSNSACSNNTINNKNIKNEGVTTTTTTTPHTGPTP